MKRKLILTVGLGISSLGVFCNTLCRGEGPTSSLFHQEARPEDKAGPTLNNASFYFQQVKPKKELKLYDLVMIDVDEKSQVTSKGDVEAKKTSTFDAVLKDWIKLNGSRILPVSPSTAPEINSSLDSDFKVNSTLDTNDGMQFKIAATVVDIRPNQTLVLEAHRTVRNNEEVWEQSLTGIVRREDVTPQNTVRSERIAELSIYKREVGHMHDSYRRGWLTRIWDTITPW
ncbi:MAG TPA: flagellar basal body L-ring protein FlgH [Pirellulales bacterium]|nr:flagellar basal body L-ring protein FlgH [Pirellulales bacterium]